ncbi:MAG TPA: DUF4239 domain-containing protein [Kofleriaceae bacterium]|nr:DUF4239 domain-containing protein [Kofleriaceae bacterium]
MRRFLLAIAGLIPIVVGAGMVTVGALWFARQWIPMDELKTSNDVVGNYLQTVGTIYAVLLAFVVSAVWGQFNEARSLVEREASELLDLFRVIDGFRTGPREVLHKGLVRYLDAVIASEWQAMTKGDEATIERIGSELDVVWRGLHCFDPETDCERSLHAEALSRFNDLSDARTSRLVAARTRMPLGLRLLLYVGALVVVASMFLLQVDRFWIHAVITGALAAAISHVLYLVEDLDDAFSGLWQVSTAPFERARRHVRAALDAAADHAPFCPVPGTED